MLNLEDRDFTLYIGDALDVLRGLPAESVHCVVTSPPYWGLRDYGATGQLGLEATRRRELIGWSDCGHNNYRPGIVLDPFLGSGTTALVARRHGRRSIGIELSPEYARLAAQRLSQLSLLAEMQA